MYLYLEYFCLPSSSYSCFCKGRRSGPGAASTGLVSGWRLLRSTSPLLFEQRVSCCWMEQNTALQQRKARLPIRTAFDCFDFIDESLDHPVAPGQTASIGHCLCIVGKTIDKSDQFHDSASPHGSFPWFQTQA